MKKITALILSLVMIFTACSAFATAAGTDRPDSKLLRVFPEALENDPETAFGIAEACIRMGDFDAAKEWLRWIAPTLEGNADIARLFRTIGSVAVEEEDWQLGYAWYVSSLLLEESEEAKQALERILRAAPDTVPFSMEEAIAYLRD